MRPEDISPIEAIKSQSGVMDNVVTTASEQLESFKLAIANFQRELKQNNTVHMVKLYFLDWGVPLFLSMLVFIRNYKAFIHFFTALFTKN
ncbi:MAG: hypothetical protein K2X26_11695 [Chitinophagaceae bacterium]|nr:hypothetical protein [Chitinophagaceae bacterium]